jgi:hypothetical protein
VSGTSQTPAEQHLGDRLAALVDGELDHDARERVQAHLATCSKCKAEADAQRSLKSVFATTAPPPPSAGLLARLQGLPGGPPGGDSGSGDGGRGQGLFDTGGFGDGVFGVREDGFGYVPAVTHTGTLPGSGFRIHEVGRPEAERSPWRGRRFAFAAASAVSFAAMALGGTMPLGTTADAPPPRGAGNNVVPMRAPGTTGPASLMGEGRRQGASAGALERSVSRAIAAAPPGILQGQAPSFSSAVLGGSAAWPVPAAPDVVLQIDEAAATPPAVTPNPSHLAAPTLPTSPLSSRR